jgi:hypothetical protein
VFSDVRGRKLRPRIARQAVEHVFQVHEWIAAADNSAQIIDQPVDATAGSQSLGDRALESGVFQAPQEVGHVLSVKCQFRLPGQRLSDSHRDHRLFG